MKRYAGAMMLWCAAGALPVGEVSAEEADALAPEQAAAIQKNFVASKHALKEYCKQTNGAQAAIFDEAWGNYLKIESPEMKAYATTPEFTTASAEVLKEYVRDAQRGGMALEGLTKTCQLALEFKKF